MTRDEIEDRVRELLSKKRGIDPGMIRPESRLKEDLGIDSFGAVEVIFEIEEAFGLQITDSDILGVRSVGDIVAYVDVWLNAQGAAAPGKKAPPAEAP